MTVRMKYRRVITPYEFEWSTSGYPRYQLEAYYRIPIIDGKLDPYLLEVTKVCMVGVKHAARHDWLITDRLDVTGLISNGDMEYTIPIAVTKYLEKKEHEEEKAVKAQRRAKKIAGELATPVEASRSTPRERRSSKRD